LNRGFSGEGGSGEGVKSGFCSRRSGGGDDTSCSSPFPSCRCCCCCCSSLRDDCAPPWSFQLGVVLALPARRRFDPGVLNAAPAPVLASSLASGNASLPLDAPKPCSAAPLMGGDTHALAPAATGVAFGGESGFFCFPAACSHHGPRTEAPTLCVVVPGIIRPRGGLASVTVECWLTMRSVSGSKKYVSVPRNSEDLSNRNVEQRRAKGGRSYLKKEGTCTTKRSQAFPSALTHASDRELTAK